MNPLELLPPEPATAFQILGLEARFMLEPAVLEARYHALARQLHPDRFLRRPPEEAALATRLTERLNGAHETLVDPLSRARHLLEQLGVPLPAGQLPRALAGRHFALMEAPGDHEAIAAFHAELVAAQAEAAHQVVELGALADAQGSGHEAIADALARHGYLAAMRRDLDQRLLAPGGPP